mmetsp:Transcript_10780/g.15718  ORF Transcript_10780/g.15718 Transcript_10780/m.15718 type:complete len:196 (+) Transcript_10780:1-588(+)
MAEAAERILAEMEQNSAKPTLMTFCTLLSCWQSTLHPRKAMRAARILEMMKERYENLASNMDKSRAEELLTNAQTMVISACCKIHPKSPDDVRRRTFQLAQEIFNEIERPTFVTYNTYFQANNNLLDDPLERDEQIRAAFLRYHASADQVHPSVWSAIKRVMTKEGHRQLLRELEGFPRRFDSPENVGERNRGIV